MKTGGDGEGAAIYKDASTVQVWNGNSMVSILSVNNKTEKTIMTTGAGTHYGGDGVAP